MTGRPSSPAPLIGFVHIQKTAGTSMKFILKNSFGTAHCDVNPLSTARGAVFDSEDLDFVRSVYPRLKSISSHELIEPTAHLPDDVMLYTMLRDPVRRAVSHFQDKNVRGHAPLAWETFIDDPANHDFQVRKIAGTDDLEKAKSLLASRYFFAGLTEQFDLSMRVFAALCPWPLNLRYQPRHVAADNALRDRILGDERACRQLEETNRLDRALYRYVETELLPAAAARAGIRDASPLPTYGARRPPPWPFVASRLYHRLVYRQRLKRARRQRARA